MMLITGVDTDLNGGLVTVQFAFCEPPKLKLITRMPVHEKKPPIHDARRCHAEGLLEAFHEAWEAGSKFAILELPAFSPSREKGVTLKHQNFGVIRATAELVFTPSRVILVSPSAWKKALKLSPDKKQSLDMASELWPSHQNLFSKMKNHGLAEAGLIAVYGKNKCT